MKQKHIYKIENYQQWKNSSINNQILKKIENSHKQNGKKIM